MVAGKMWTILDYRLNNGLSLSVKQDNCSTKGRLCQFRFLVIMELRDQAETKQSQHAPAASVNKALDRLGSLTDPVLGAEGA